MRKNYNHLPPSPLPASRSSAGLDSIVATGFFLDMAARPDDARIIEAIEVAPTVNDLSGSEAKTAVAHTLGGKKPCSGVIGRKKWEPGQDRPMSTDLTRQMRRGLAVVVLDCSQERAAATKLNCPRKPHGRSSAYLYGSSCRGPVNAPAFVQPQSVVKRPLVRLDVRPIFAGSI